MGQFYRPIEYAESDFGLAKEWFLDYGYGPGGVKVSLSNMMTDSPGGEIVRVIPWLDVGKLYSCIAEMIPDGAIQPSQVQTGADPYRSPSVFAAGAYGRAPSDISLAARRRPLIGPSNLLCWSNEGWASRRYPAICNLATWRMSEASSAARSGRM
jgi:hypothetical protein